MSDRDTIERAIRHIDSCLDVDPWARDIAIDAMRRLLEQESYRHITGKLEDLISRQSAYETLTDYYHHTTQTQHDALRDALSRVPSVQPEPRGVVPHRNYQYLSDYWCKCGWHLGKKGDVKYCPDCGRKVIWDE